MQINQQPFPAITKTMKRKSYGFFQRKPAMTTSGLVLMTSLACACADLDRVHNEKCDAVKYGNQIVKAFFQKMTGTDFDGTGGNTITTEADWDTRIAATGANKIVAISNMTSAERPSILGNVEDGNAVPYGGKEIIDRIQSITFDLKYASAHTFLQLDMVQCWGLTRFWFLDNMNWLWAYDTTGAGNPDATLLGTTYGQKGIGTRNKAEKNEITWNNLKQPVPVAQLAFLQTKDEAYGSGS